MVKPTNAKELFSMMTLLLVLAAPTMAVDVTLNSGTKYQTIEGFGGGFMFGIWPYGRRTKDALYDSIFVSARCNIVRIGNWYNPQKPDEIPDEVPMMKEIQEKFPQVKVTIASWTPPAYLKQNDTIAGKIGDQYLSLKKQNGDFIYDQYGDYWKQSIECFQNGGVKLHWISIQNEPDWPADYEGCMMVPNSSFGDYAVYGKALDAVYSKVSSLGVPLIACDNTGPEGNWLANKNATTEVYLQNIDLSKIAAVSHHFYNGRDITRMRSLKQNYGSKPRFQTEYLINETATDAAWFEHVKLISDALIEEEVSMYCIFALAYKPASTHTFFSIDTLTDNYSIRPIYYGFKHYSKSIGRGWKRIGASGGSGTLKVSAYANSAGDSAAVVLVNTGGATTVTLKGIPSAVDTGEVFQTTKAGGENLSKKYQRIAGFGKTPSTIQLDGSSITTVDLWKYEKPVGVTASLMERKSLFLHASLNRGNRIVATVSLRQGQVVTLTCTDVTGKLIDRSTVRGVPGGTVKHTFNGPFAGGTYLVKMEGTGAGGVTKVVVP